MSVLFCFGLGYSGARLARRACRAGFRVLGTSRKEHARKEYKDVEVLSFDDEERVRWALDRTTHLVTCVPPHKASETNNKKDKKKDKDEEAREDAVLARYGDALGKIPWLCYYSSLSVYGDHGGGEVDEETAPAFPLSVRGEKRLAAERAWQRLATRGGARLCVMRIAGIYGEGRNALLRVRDKKGKPFVESAGVFNRIHVDDLVEAVLCAARKRATGIFNICDDVPSLSHAPILYAAKLLGLEAPELVSVEEARTRGLLSEMALSFHGECKRAKNGKMRKELEVALRYADYRAGLIELAQRT